MQFQIKYKFCKHDPNQQKEILEMLHLIKPCHTNFSLAGIDKYMNQNKVEDIYVYLEVSNKPREFQIKYIQYDYIQNNNFAEQLEKVKSLLFSPKFIKSEQSIMNFLKDGDKLVKDYKVVTYVKEMLGKMIQCSLKSVQFYKLKMKLNNQVIIIKLYYVISLNYDTQNLLKKFKKLGLDIKL